MNARPSSAVHLIGTGTRRRTVMIVADREDTRLMLTLWIHRRTRLVVNAIDAASALEAIEAGCRPDVVLIDLVGEGVDAATLVRALGRVPDVADVPLVVMTETRHPERLARELRCDVVEKPADAERVKSLVDSLLDDGAVQVLT